MPAKKVTLNTLGDHMFAAAKSEFGKKFKLVKHFVRGETQKLAITLRMIIEASAQGDISSTEAAILLEQQKIAASAVFTAAEGMTVVAAQAGINAALKAVRDFVNGKLGFELL
jgi:hypothetical protein